jgi:hypothetical protein
MALFHFHVGQIKRSAGQSAIAAAAYRAGEKLYSDYYGEFSDYTNKGGVVHAEILLPPHAPKEYADRQTLWNAVEKIEQHPKAQLAYSFDIALQNEFSLEENIALARLFLLEQFVSRGMTVDFAIHMPDPEEGGIPNPHFHVICPIRPLKEDGAWGAKQHRVYELDEDGNRLRDENGNYIFNAVPTTDWGSPETLEHWRQAWSDLCNAKFEEKHLPERIDHRSYARQGLDLIPTVHEGPAVRQMEARGIRTNKGDLNRWIKATNDLLRRIKKRIAELLDLLAESKAEKAESILELLSQFYNVRNAGAYTNKAKSNNLKQYSLDLIYLEERGIVTVAQFEEYFSQVRQQVNEIRDAQNARAARMKELKNLLQLAEDYARLKPIVDAIPPKGGWGKKHEKYMAEHDSEIRQFYAIKRKLDSYKLPDKKLTIKAWQSELDKLSKEYAVDSEKLKPINADLKQLRDIQYKINTAQHDQQKQTSIQQEQTIS